MKKQILSIIVNFVVTGLLGYLVATLKDFKKKKKEKDDKIFTEIEYIKKKLEKIDQEDLKQMKADLSNKFFIYDAMDEVEDYLVESFRNDCERYFDRDGDSWVHPMYEKSFEWDIKPTGYLK